MSEPFVPAVIELGARPLAARATAMVLHGILGSAGNWRSFVRRLVERSEPARALRWLLVDLRGHGDSSQRTAPPPHTIDACAGDLKRLADALAVDVDLVIGHSFGGKVALAFARDHSPATRAAWFLDTTLGPAVDTDRLSDVARVIDVVSSIAEPLPGRAEVAAHVRDAGLSEMLAQWMTTNVRGNAESGYRWKFDLAIVRALIADYARLDLWPAVEDPRPGLAVHGVIGGKSDRFDAAARARLERLGAGVTDVIPDAGHWLHVDRPDALARLFERAARGVIKG